jgi:CheY-like chemotaxis protein
VPDVIVLDLTMPDLDGLEVTRRLRQLDVKVPIVLSSGHADDSVERSLSAGAVQAFLPKPYGVTELLAVLAHARSMNPS